METRYTAPNADILYLAAIDLICQSTGEIFQKQEDVSDEFEWK